MIMEQNERDILTDTVLDKIEQQDKKIQTHDKRLNVAETRLADVPGIAKDLDDIRSEVRSMAEFDRRVKITDGKLQELSRRLDSILNILSQPQKTEVRHHHHVPLTLWITASLFFLLCLVSMGWLFTGQKLDQFRANDIKYRYLKVSVDSAANLLTLDSAFDANPDSLQNLVTTNERLKQRRLELLGQIHAVDSQIVGGRIQAGKTKNRQK